MVLMLIMEEKSYGTHGKRKNRAQKDLERSWVGFWETETMKIVVWLVIERSGSGFGSAFGIEMLGWLVWLWPLDSPECWFGLVEYQRDIGASLGVYASLSSCSNSS